jgi:hypothetical protein
MRGERQMRRPTRQVLLHATACSNRPPSTSTGLGAAQSTVLLLGDYFGADSWSFEFQRLVSGNHSLGIVNRHLLVPQREKI